MTLDEVYELIKSKQPMLIYISGKTSTGKSTFTKKLFQDLGYQILELDQIVKNAVIKPLSLANQGAVFVEVYRERNHRDWIKLFIQRTQEQIEKHIKHNENLIVEGAIANPITLQELFGKFPQLTFIYFHPKKIDKYIRNLTTRFKTVRVNSLAGLPPTFWTFIDTNEFNNFCKNRVISEKIKVGISTYALLSQEESKSRLEEFKKHFKNINVVEI